MIEGYSVEDMDANNMAYRSGEREDPLHSDPEELAPQDQPLPNSEGSDGLQSSPEILDATSHRLH